MLTAEGVIFKNGCYLFRKVISGKIIKHDILRQKNSDQKTNIFPWSSLVSLLCNSSSVKLHAILLSNFYSTFAYKSSVKEKKNDSLILVFSPIGNSQVAEESLFFFLTGTFLW